MPFTHVQKAFATTTEDFDAFVTQLQQNRDPQQILQDILYFQNKQRKERTEIDGKPSTWRKLRLEDVYFCWILYDSCFLMGDVYNNSSNQSLLQIHSNTLKKFEIHMYKSLTQQKMHYAQMTLFVAALDMPELCTPCNRKKSWHAFMQNDTTVELLCGFGNSRMLRNIYNQQWNEIKKYPFGNGIESFLEHARQNGLNLGLDNDQDMPPPFDVLKERLRFAFQALNDRRQKENNYKNKDQFTRFDCIQWFFQKQPQPAKRPHTLDREQDDSMDKAWFPIEIYM